MMVKAVNVVFVNYYIAAFFINIVFSYLFCYFFYSISRHYFPRKEALGILIFVLCFPTAFYMTAFYTEALFMTLLFGFVYYYAIEKSNKSLLFIFLLPLCRAQAFFVFGAILIYLFTEYFKNNKIDWKRQYYNLAAFLGGVLSYFLFLYFVTGNAFSGMEAQEKYFSANKNSIRNILNPNYFLEYLFSSVNTYPPRERRLPSEYYEYFNLFFGWVNNILIDKLFIIVSLFSLYFVYKTKNTLWLLLYFMLLYPVASMGVGTSFTRFALAFAPILALSLWKNYPNKKRILYSITLFFLCLQIYFIYRFSLGMWVA